LSTEEEPEVAMAQRAPCVRRTAAYVRFWPVQVSGHFRARKLLCVIQERFLIRSCSPPGFFGLFEALPYQ
jgi:hypothetical protein